MEHSIIDNFLRLILDSANLFFVLTIPALEDHIYLTDQSSKLAHVLCLASRFVETFAEEVPGGPSNLLPSHKLKTLSEIDCLVVVLEDIAVPLARFIYSIELLRFDHEPCVISVCSQ